MRTDAAELGLMMHTLRVYVATHFSPASRAAANLCARAKVIMASPGVAALLDTLGLAELAPSLTRETLSAWETLSRVELLAHLKACGVAKLGHRQSIANGLGRLLREGAAAPPPPASRPAQPPPTAPPPVLPPAVLPPLSAPVFIGDSRGAASQSRAATSPLPPMPLTYRLHRPSTAPGGARPYVHVRLQLSIDPSTPTHRARYCASRVAGRYC